jgi:hypothetical protein
MKWNVKESKPKYKLLKDLEIGDAYYFNRMGQKYVVKRVVRDIRYKYNGFVLNSKEGYTMTITESDFNNSTSKKKRCSTSLEDLERVLPEIEGYEIKEGVTA